MNNVGNQAYAMRSNNVIQGPFIRPGGEVSGQFALNRRKQINTLMIFNENVSEVQPGYQYRVDFEVGPNQSKVTLMVYLPPDFPSVKPTICVQSQANVQVGHPWLDSNLTVRGAPGLLNFSVHSDLGRVVQAIKREFEKNLQVSTSEHSRPLSQNPPTPAYGATPKVPSGPVQQQPPFSIASHQQGQVGSLHALPASQSLAIPEMATLTLDDLKEMKDHDEAVDIFCQKQLAVPMRTRLAKETQGLTKDVKELATANQALYEELSSAKTKYQAVLDHVQSERQAVSAISQDIRRMSDSFNPAKVGEQLSRSSLEEEAKSDNLAESFLQGEMSTDVFLRQYLASRTRYHTIKVKGDKLKLVSRRHW